MQGNEHLRKLRIGRNWRQQDLADQLGVTVVTIQRWERGIQHPSAYYRVKLCTLFGLSSQELGLVEGFPPPPESTMADAVPTGSAPRRRRCSGRCRMHAILTLPDAMTCLGNWSRCLLESNQIDR